LSYIIGQVISLIKLLHSENGAGQIAAGLTLGLLMGLSPIVSIQGLIFIILLLALRVQIGAALAMTAVTKFFAVILISPLASTGAFVLEMKQLNGLFIKMYNAPIIPFTNFNHSVVMGGFVFSVVFGPMIFILFLILIKKYQLNAVEKVRHSKVGKAIQASSLYQWYLKYSNLTK
jgi:uncharacterized protein (TIGR03546 family)